MNISVIIPCFNTARYLSYAIESVLEQTIPATEIIIVDDGSTDDSIAVASTYAGMQVRIISSTHQGIAVTRNIGIRSASGEYIAFLDADDVWCAEKLAKQSKILAEQPAVQGVFGKLQQFVSTDLTDDEKQRYICPSRPQDGYHAGCLLMKREEFMRVGWFNENLSAGEFIEWYIRAKQMNTIFAMPDQVVMYRRIHGNNTVISERSDIYAEYIKVIRMKLKYEAEQSRSQTNDA